VFDDPPDGNKAVAGHLRFGLKPNRENGTKGRAILVI
jgi:hypothetical protein